MKWPQFECSKSEFALYNEFKIVNITQKWVDKKMKQIKRKIKAQRIKEIEQVRMKIALINGTRWFIRLIRRHFKANRVV